MVKITAELERMGYLPRVASDTVHVTGGGLFHVSLRPEEFHDLLAILAFSQGLEEETETAIFEERLRPLIERLSHDPTADLNQETFVKPLLAAFKKNF